MYIGFNKPYLTGNETLYIQQAVALEKISGDGEFTRRCHRFFEQKYGFRKVLLTTSCTDALEMAALLIGIGPGDEVIMPSYTFVSTSNAFVLRGATIVFADSSADNPNMDAAGLEPLITSRTKAIVPVHYAGIACDMDEIMQLARKHNLFVIEDAAQAIDSYYRDRPLGGIGHLAAFSFHETKNIMAGEGGMLVINDERFLQRAEIIREKGTNRSAFFRGEVDKYGWVDVGSSFLPSDIIAAFLYAQLENLDNIQRRRRQIWEWYQEGLTALESCGLLRLPQVPDYATNNAHMFYVVCRSGGEREGLIAYLKREDIQAVFHYLSLHGSPYYRDKHDGRQLTHSDMYSDCLVRLPMYYELTREHVQMVTSAVKAYYHMLTPPPSSRSVKSGYESP
jgi:dTDP-4-amino-4,6-dideoxygalactose transaminase